MKTFLQFAAAAVLAALIVGPDLRADDKKEPGADKRAVWMKQKLKLSQNILTGLTEGDFDKINANANAMIVADYLQKWLAPEKPQHFAYELQRHNFEFYNRELVRQAKDKNIDGAALAYHFVTASCIECHKIVRDVKK